LNYESFRKTVDLYPLVSWPMIKMLMPANQQIKVQISRWKKKGKLVPLNKNLFVLNEADRKIRPSRLYMACEMYKPSYISLEYALSFHGLIPEGVADITCITTKKTMKFVNPFGSFSYRHIQTWGFSGFSTKKDEAGLSYYMAEPEKALVDFIYLNLEKFRPGMDCNSFLKESYRLQGMDTLKKRKLLEYAGLFRNRKLLSVIQEVRT